MKVSFQTYEADPGVSIEVSGFLPHHLSEGEVTGINEPKDVSLRFAKSIFPAHFWTYIFYWMTLNSGVASVYCEMLLFFLLILKLDRLILISNVYIRLILLTIELSYAINEKLTQILGFYSQDYL